MHFIIVVHFVVYYCHYSAVAECTAFLSGCITFNGQVAVNVLHSGRVLHSLSALHSVNHIALRAAKTP